MELVLAPDLNADLLPLVQHPEQWRDAFAALLQSGGKLQMFEQQIGIDNPATYDPVPDYVRDVGPNYYDRLRDAGFFAELTALDIPLAIETPGLKAWDTENGIPTGKQAAFALTRAINRVLAAGGGLLSSYSMDDPLAASLSDFPEPVPIETVVAVLCRVAKAGSDMLVEGGWTEAYPTCSPAQIIDLGTRLRAAGWLFRHLHMDVDEQHAKQTKTDEEIAADFKELQAACRSWGIPFGIILNGQRGNTPEDYRVGFWEWFEFARKMLGGDPDRWILESWKKNNLPVNLPESSHEAHTGLLREVAALLPVPEPPLKTRQIAVVLPKELAGASVYVDDVGGGKTVVAESNGAHAVAPFRLTIGADCSDAFTYLKVDLEGYKPYRKDGVLLHAGPVQVRVGVAGDPNRHSDTFLPAVQPNTSTVARALMGPLRVVHHAPSKTHSFADDSGPRRVLFCSWFCALRDWHDDEGKALAVLDRIVEAGYQGIRIFRFLGESDTSGYFAGRAVLPEWSIEALLGFARACQSRGLRLALTSGRQWGYAEWLAWETRCAKAIQVANLAVVVALWEGTNEYWQNAPGHNSDEQIAFYGTLFAMVRATLSPAPICAIGAPEDESPDKLYRASTHSDICEKHGSRDEDKCVKRGFTVWYWEGDPGHFGKPFWEGEPVPPPSPDAFMPCSSPGRVFATLAMNQMVGSAVTFFSGDAVRGRDPSVSIGFTDVPRLMATLPEDVAHAVHVSGGNIWWWTLPDGRFATVADEQWGAGALEPPRAVKSYTVIGPGWATREGTGAPRLNAGDGGALIVGDFA